MVQENAGVSEVPHYSNDTSDERSENEAASDYGPDEGSHNDEPKISTSSDVESNATISEQEDVSDDAETVSCR